MLAAFLCQVRTLYLLHLSVCVCVIGKEIPYGGNMGPGQGGSRSEMGLGGRKYLGRTLGPGQGGSQDYFAKKGEVLFRSENSIFTKVR